MKAVVLCVSLALTGTALADGATSQSLGNGYTLIADKTGINIVKGKLRARLADGVSILDAKVDRKADSVAVTVEDNSCEMKHDYTWTFGNLNARLENTAAYRLHKAKDYANAAAGFARAAAADPTWNIPAYNLASAKQLLGDKDAAVAALAPWIAKAPLATYLQVTSDPELSPLLDRPELKAIRAAAPGNASVTAKGDLDGTVAYSKDKGLLAIARQESGWGCGGMYTRDLEIYEAKTGKLVATTPLVRWDESSDGECMDGAPNPMSPRFASVVGKRAKALTAMLRELGFVKAKVERGTKSEGDDGKELMRFAKAKVGVVARDGTARAVLKNKDLGSVYTERHMDEAYYVDDPRAVIVWSGSPGREGCDATDPTAVGIIPLPNP